MARFEDAGSAVNHPQQVTLFLASYYPTSDAGQNASVIGVQFISYADAVMWGRTKLAAEGAGVVLIARTEGWAMYPLYEPEPS